MTLQQRIEDTVNGAIGTRRATGSVQTIYTDERHGAETVKVVSSKRATVVFVDGVLYVGGA